MECANGTRGIELQLNAEKETKAIATEIVSKSRRFGVPAIVFDKVIQICSSINRWFGKNDTDFS